MEDPGMKTGLMPDRVGACLMDREQRTLPESLKEGPCTA